MAPIDELLAAVRAYHQMMGATGRPEILQALTEVEARLARLGSQYSELLRLNEALLATDPILPTTSFDPDTDTLTVGSGEQSIRIKLKRADPSVPLRIHGVAGGAAYQAGSKHDQDPGRAELRKQLERLLEDFYQSAHRVQKLIQEITGHKRIKPTKITIVRNKLVEHPAFGDYYSFGYSSSGPTVRPIHRPGREWVDEGLIPNVADFVARLRSLLE